MRERLRVHPKHNDCSSLIEAVGADVLPLEYGGTNGKVQDHIGNFAVDSHCHGVWATLELKKCLHVPYFYSPFSLQKHLFVWFCAPHVQFFLIFFQIIMAPLNMNS
jgi:hypothetical protein